MTKKKSTTKIVYQSLGLIFLVLSILMVVLSFFQSGQQVVDLNWLFYLFVGLIHLKKGELYQLQKTKPWVGWLLALPAILGLLIVILTDATKMSLGISIDIFTVILYSVTLAMMEEVE